MLPPIPAINIALLTEGGAGLPNQGRSSLAISSALRRRVMCSLKWRQPLLFALKYRWTWPS